MTRRSYGVPATKGPLIIRRESDGVEIARIGQIEADRAARQTVRATQGPGKVGRSM